MIDSETAVKQVRAALEIDNAINLHRYPVKVSVNANALVLEGEVESVAAKKLALVHAGAAVDGDGDVVDRLRVMPAQRCGDGAIRDGFAAMLAGQREYSNCGIRTRSGSVTKVVRAAPEERSGDIEIGVEDGVIHLKGSVISLSHKRVAGVLAWWTPGCRDVANDLGLDPPERDNDEEVVEALSLVFEMDQELDGGQIGIGAHDGVVTLEGFVSSDTQRRRAELDAWALFGVSKVVNHIDVRA
ncbi:MAG: BON domain-containing protein [Casimicrobiaceae bacterium]